MIDKNDFEKWVIENHPRVTRPDKYSSALKTISNHLKSKGIASFELFRLSNSSDASFLRKKYFSYREFKQQNERGNHMYSRSFDLLIEYLESQEISKNKSSKKRIVIQPIGPDHSEEDFLIYYRDRWAEKDRYRKQWEQSENATVLFTKDGNIFAKALITKIKESNDEEYPLDYYYDHLLQVNNVDYKIIIQLCEHPIKAFRTYMILNEKHSQRIFHYLNSLDVYVGELEADTIIQNEINDIDSLELEEKPQPVKDPVEQNGRKVYPRNLAYAKKALENADYKCEVDEKHVTFISKSSGQQYVEAHHLIPMKYQSRFSNNIDVPANIVSLCPICHRRLHHSSMEDKEQTLQTLLEIKQAKLEIFGIEIGLEELKSYYV